MLYLEKNDIITVKKNRKCSVCKDQKALWRAFSTENEEVDFCSWCFLYSNKSKWGVKNKDEILYAGRACLEESIKSKKKKLVALDKRGRLSHGDCDKYVYGIIVSSRLLRGSLGRFVGVEVSDEEQTTKGRR